MALQRKNFRCPRDGIAMSPLKGSSHTSGATGSSLVVSHAELPPRQRKRLQVGSTNLPRSASSPELTAPLSLPLPQKTIMDGDLSSAARHTRETNIALIKSTMHDGAARRLWTAAVSTQPPGVVVLSEKRRQQEHALGQAQAQYEGSSEDATQETNLDGSVDQDGMTWVNHGHTASTPAAAASEERTFFLETRRKLYDAFVDRYGSVRAVFRAFDRDANGLISYQRFADMVEASQVELTPRDVARVFRHVDVNGDNCIEFQEFSEMFTASKYVPQASAYSPTKATTVTTDPTSSLSLKFRAPLDLSPRTRDRMKELRLKVNGELLLKHGRDLGVHGGKTENLLIYAFKQFDTDNDGFLSYAQVKKALGKDYLQLAMDPNEMDEMVRLIDRNADEQISMREFVQYFGAGEKELPTDLLDNGRRKALAALHHKANAPLTPRHEVDPLYGTLVDTAPLPPLPTLDAGGCLQENLARRIATSPVFRSAPLTVHERQRLQRAQTSHAMLGSSQSTPSIALAKTDLGPTLRPLAVTSQDRHAYWREQHTVWSRVGVGGDGVRADAALFSPERDRFQTTTRAAYSPLRRGANSYEVFRDDVSTSEHEAQARAVRRQTRYEHTQNLLLEMETKRAQAQRLCEWKARAKVRLGAARRFEYLDKIHDQEQHVAMREQQMAKRHGGARFHRMWAGSAESQFNNTHVTGGQADSESHF